MDDRLQAALIAGVISIVVALISAVTSRFRARAERQALILSQRHAFVEKLLELRLDAYPQALEITKSVGKRGRYSDEEVSEIIKEARSRLDRWQSEKSGLLLSKSSLKAYYALRDALSKNPAEQGCYTDAQLKKIWVARNAFRGSLRDDVGLLHDD